MKKIIILFLLLLCFKCSAATYYLDAIDGSDDNAGTSALPWKTLTKAQATITEGDTVKLRTGDYGMFQDLSVVDHTAWTTFEADTGETPRFSKGDYEAIRLWSNKNTYPIPIDIKFIFRGITVYHDGAFIQNMKNVKFYDCIFIGPGYPMTTPYDVLGTINESYAIYLGSTSGILIDGCTIGGDGNNWDAYVGWDDTSKVAVVDGSPIITGTNTSWTNAQVGKVLSWGTTGVGYTVASVEDNTHLTLTENCIVTWKLTLDTSPSPSVWAVGATITGAASSKTCSVVSQISNTVYYVNYLSGAFTDGEILSDGTNSIDCAVGYPQLSASTSNLAYGTTAPSYEGHVGGIQGSEGGYGMGYGRGIYCFAPLQDVIINDCNIGSCDTGISGIGDSNCLVTNNEIHHVTFDFLTITGSEASTPVIIENNHIHDGIDMYTGKVEDGVPLVDSFAHCDGIQGNAYATPITNDLYTLDGLIIRNNIIHHSDCVGMYLRGSYTLGRYNSNWTIENNLVYDMGLRHIHIPGYAICLRNCDGIIFRNNTVLTGHLNSIKDIGAGMPCRFSQLTGNIIEKIQLTLHNGQTIIDYEDYNIINQINYGSHLYIWNTHDTVFNAYRANPVLTAQLEALFTNYDTNDFTLASDSIAISHGNPTYHSTTDILGTAWGTYPDAGCYAKIITPEPPPPPLSGNKCNVWLGSGGW